MQYSHQVIVKRWLPILKEYERTKAKVEPRPFKFVKDLCKAHYISGKELARYYRKWVEGGKLSETLLPKKRGARPGSRRTPKDIERNIVKAYRQFGSNRYELVLLFKPYYLDKTPSPATMDRIKARYPLNEKEKKIIKRYEKKSPGELAHIDVSKLTKDLRLSFKNKNSMLLPFAMIAQEQPMPKLLMTKELLHLPTLWPGPCLGSSSYTTLSLKRSCPIMEQNSKELSKENIPLKRCALN